MGLEALILAAGVGRRLAPLGPKPVVKILDLPLIAYPLRSLFMIGVIEAVIVVNGENKPLIEAALREIENIPEVDYIVNPRPELGNGYSFLLGSQSMSGDFLLSMSDHIYPPTMAERISSSEAPSMGIDSDPSFIEISEATKVWVSGQRVLEVSKSLEAWDGVDVGLHHLIPVEIEMPRGPVELSDLLTAFARGSHLGYIDIRGCPWTEIDTLEDVESLLSGTRRRVLERVREEWQ
ncbi:MAG: NTP transferase domain-containing protein [Thermoplasmata archaeon]|nr:NTP transferase domain-containing protein [Thermoplasmata archaeon]